MKDKVSGKEFAWYLTGATISVFGIILMIFGIIGHHLNVSAENNFIKVAEKALMDGIKVPFDFRIWGILIFLLGIAVVVIALAINAKKTDREVDKQLRRQQRQAALKDNTIEVKSAVEIIEEPAPQVEVAPANEAK